jgi:hypothetical protein
VIKIQKETGQSERTPYNKMSDKMPQGASYFKKVAVRMKGG